MGKPLMIQVDDDRRLEGLKRSLRAKSKVAVLRRALETLEQRLERQRRIKRWMRAAKLVARESRRVNRAFQTSSRLKRI